MKHVPRWTWGWDINKNTSFSLYVWTCLGRSSHQSDEDQGQNNRPPEATGRCLSDKVGWGGIWGIRILVIAPPLDTGARPRPRPRPPPPPLPLLLLHTSSFKFPGLAFSQTTHYNLKWWKNRGDERKKMMNWTWWKRGQRREEEEACLHPPV